MATTNKNTIVPKFSIEPQANDKTMSNASILWGVRELRSGMTLTAFLDDRRAKFGAIRGIADSYKLKDPDGSVVDECRMVASKALPITRAVMLACKVAEIVNGRLSSKIAEIAKDENLWKAVEEVEKAKEKEREIRNIIASDIRRAEISAIRGNIRALTTENEKVKHYESAGLSADLESAKEATKEARRRENALCAQFVAKHFPQLVKGLI